MTDAKDVAVRPVGALAITAAQAEFTTAQLDAFGIGKATHAEQLVFLHTAQRTGLDPAARQIYMIGRWDPQTGRDRYVIQTGIDGYRLIARRAAEAHGETISYGDTLWCGINGTWRDAWLAEQPPAAAKVTVYRSGQAFPTVAGWREYVQTRRDGTPNRMWATMPANQLAKCAEALALRRAFPQELSGIYTDDETIHAIDPEPITATITAEEMAGGHDTPEVGAVEETPPGLDQRRSRRMFALFRDAGITDREERLAYAAAAIGRPITTSADLTADEADRVIDRLVEDAAVAWPMTADQDGPTPEDT